MIFRREACIEAMDDTEAMLRAVSARVRERFEEVGVTEDDVAAAIEAVRSE